LQHHHQGVMPVMITEFGVPSSLGSAHAGTLGRSQGNHTELEALQMAMAGISDPSSHQALIPQGLFRATSVMIPGIGLTISTGGRHVRNTGTVRWNNWQKRPLPGTGQGGSGRGPRRLFSGQRGRSDGIEA
jgi:hypothetical protein